MAARNGKMLPNTTAPKKARSVTLGPNGSFPAGDANHQRLAISGATRSERAGNISPATADKIKAEARAMLKGGSGSDKDGTKPAPKAAPQPTPKPVPKAAPKPWSSQNRPATRAAGRKR